MTGFLWLIAFPRPPDPSQDLHSTQAIAPAKICPRFGKFAQAATAQAEDILAGFQHDPIHTIA